MQSVGGFSGRIQISSFQPSLEEGKENPILEEQASDHAKEFEGTQGSSLEVFLSRQKETPALVEQNSNDSAEHFAAVLALRNPMQEEQLLKKQEQEDDEIFRFILDDIENGQVESANQCLDEIKDLAQWIRIYVKIRSKLGSDLNAVSANEHERECYCISEKGILATLANLLVEKIRLYFEELRGRFSVSTKEQIIRCLFKESPKELVHLMKAIKSEDRELLLECFSHFSLEDLDLARDVATWIHKLDSDSLKDDVIDVFTGASRAKSLAFFIEFLKQVASLQKKEDRVFGYSLVDKLFHKVSPSDSVDDFKSLFTELKGLDLSDEDLSKTILGLLEQDIKNGFESLDSLPFHPETPLSKSPFMQNFKQLKDKIFSCPNKYLKEELVQRFCLALMEIQTKWIPNEMNKKQAAFEFMIFLHRFKLEKQPGYEEVMQCNFLPFFRALQVQALQQTSEKQVELEERLRNALHSLWFIPSLALAYQKEIKQSINAFQGHAKTRLSTQFEQIIKGPVQTDFLYKRFDSEKIQKELVRIQQNYGPFDRSALSNKS
jgi:hypothetical protein